MIERPQPKLTGILNKLIKNQVHDTEHSNDFFKDSNSKIISLGVPLIKCDNGNFCVDISKIDFFSGIPELTRTLLSRFNEEYQKNKFDIIIRQPVNSEVNPELFKLGITNISITARSKTAKELFVNSNIFQNHLLNIFYALQTSKWGGVLFPDYYSRRNSSVENFLKKNENSDFSSNTEIPALLYHFYIDGYNSQQEKKYIILTEFDYTDKFLSLTIENSFDSRLNLKRISHRTMDSDYSQSSFIDIDKISNQIYKAVYLEAQNQKNEYFETPFIQPELFNLLISSGMQILSLIKFRWNIETSSKIILEPKNNFIILLAKIIRLLHDPDIIKILYSNNLIEVSANGNKIYFDVSRGGTCLNICFEEERPKTSASSFLDKMPALKKTVINSNISIENFRILLIHHSTSEILGFINALKELKCGAVSTLFIKYKGVMPDNYIDVLFSFPDEIFKFYSLQRIESFNSVEVKYVLSNQYSPIKEFNQLNNQLLNEKPDFFKAMIMTAAHIFFRELIIAKANNQKLLIIEDGGYLAPLLNQYCLENKKLNESIELLGVKNFFLFKDISNYCSESNNTLLYEFLEHHNYCGSIEHTRNGFDNLQKINNTFNKLSFPALSIAVSKLKNTEEARECASAILNAFETILHSSGLILSARNIAVLGCRGNIGRNLFLQLSHRKTKGILAGIDISVDPDEFSFLDSGTELRIAERNSLDVLEDELFNNIDTFIGVTSKSIIKKNHIEKLLLTGSKPILFFISGSTKTLEFEDLSDWIQTLQNSQNQNIGDMKVKINITHIKDPQTGLIQGNRVRIIFDKKTECGLDYKDLYLLGDLMPLNFLYYGVPTETMDLIFDQLLKLTLGFINKINTDNKLPIKLLAIDRDIDENADLL
ncbi:hypothetical protein KA977_08165 [Candidatus Dependentiae bacterium]|nr:hypothetical protein [Candidatus Dependentiae bacterium]